VERWPAPQRAAWRAAGVTEVKNARTGQVLPLYPDVLDDIERNAAALDITAAARRITVPWIIVHGTEDEAVDLAEGQRLAAAAPRARFVPVEGAGHTIGAVHPWQGAPPALEQVEDTTLAFFAEHLR
jgi:pimeloyl-ACP methyl ester carboxylesterase